MIIVKINQIIKINLFSAKKEELIKFILECIEIQKEISDIIIFIKRNALNKSIFGHFGQLINLIIKLEQTRKENGWKKRINYYKNMNEVKRINLEKFQEIMNNIKTYLENEINECLNYNVENLDGPVCSIF